MRNKSFMITGGNFTNKGAQSMLLITIAELRQRFQDCDIVIVPLDRADDYKKYNLKNVVVIDNHPDIHEADRSFLKMLFLAAKNFVRYILKRNYVIRGLWEYRNALNRVDAVIDISGFCLSSQFSLDYNIQFLELIEDAHRHQIPTILMPQSFGPFDYGARSDIMISRIKSTLYGASLIFAREKRGYDLLTEELGLNNVVLSPDMVLQNKTVNFSYVFCDDPKISLPKLEKQGNVALIPNSMNATQCEMQLIIEMYGSAVRKLGEINKVVHLVYHSDADRDFCRSIFESVEDKSNVVFHDRAFACYEYDRFVRTMDFVVASRYHSIVHAYKNCVPALILGWADKYYALAELFGQENLVFDVRERVDYEKLYKQLSVLSDNCSIYSAMIRSKIDAIQEENCFDKIEEIL